MVVLVVLLVGGAVVEVDVVEVDDVVVDEPACAGEDVEVVEEGPLTGAVGL